MLDVKRALRQLRNLSLAAKFQTQYAFRSNSRLIEPGLIVTLTSFPGRLKNLHLVIKSLLIQTKVPEKIILYLSRQEMNGVLIPKNLNSLVGDVFFIEIVDENFRSYNKIIHALKEHTDKRIVTVDDDILYPPYMLERLIKSAESYPDKVICSIGRRMEVGKDGLYEYMKWPYCTPGEDSMVLPLGVYGVLYPIGCFHRDVTEPSLFLSLAPTADDLWLKVMTSKQRVRSLNLGLSKKAFKLVDRNEGDFVGLFAQNRLGGNDKAINNLLDYFQTKDEPLLI